MKNTLWKMDLMKSN